jgi:hypothetical protein
LTELGENFTGSLESKSPLPPERLGDVLEDPPVLFRVAGRVDRLVDLDDPPLGRAGDTFVLLVLGAGQNHVCEPAGFAEEEVNVRIELELAQHALNEVAIWQGYDRVERPGQHPLDLARLHFAEDLVAVDPGMRQFRLGNAPEVGDELPVQRVLDVPTAGQLVCLLAVLSASLAVPLAGNGGVTASRPTDPT